MIVEFTHPELGEDVQGRAGFYTPLEEFTMPYNGREVLYILGTARLERACCGAAGVWGYVQVPGFLVRRQVHGGGNAPTVSEVEIIENEDDRNRIREALLQKYQGAQIDLWGTQFA